MTAIRQGSTAGGVVSAALLAGPIFICATLLAVAFDQLPRPIDVTADSLGIFVAMLFASLIYGLPVGGIVSTLGTGGMLLLGDHFAFARPRISWLIAGVTLSALFSFLVIRDEYPFAFATIVTGGACAWLSKGSMVWVETPREGVD
jgi:hypothetical protein